MNTQEILSIVALSLLGLCLLCGLAKMAMRGDGAKKNCDKACSMVVFATVVLLAISQLIGETEAFGADQAGGYCEILPTNAQAQCSATNYGGLCGHGSGNPPFPDIACPRANKCGSPAGTIDNECGGGSGCPPTGTGEPARRAIAAWCNNKCGPPWSSN